MKIESINVEYTKDVNEVALDFDVDIDDNFLKSLQSKSEYYKRKGEDQKGALGTQSSDNILKKIPYISFCRIKGNNRVLTITVTTTANQDWKSGNGSPVTIAREHIAIINNFLSEIEDNEKEKNRQRDDLLDQIANNTGLRRNDRQPSKKRAYATDLNL